MIGNTTQAWSDWNFLEGELDIVRRIKEAVQTGPGAWARIVGTRDDLDDIKEEQQVTPGVYVIYAGFSVKDANTSQATIEHRWRVVLAVATATPGREASPRNQVAGQFLPSLLQALHGFIPAGSTTGLVPATPPPSFPNGKFSYYPLSFVSDTIYTTRKGPAIGPLPLDRRT
jgi:hypothetical protein